MVFADDIVLYKQRYRLVAMDGLMAKSYVTGNNILIDDVKKEKIIIVQFSDTFRISITN